MIAIVETGADPLRLLEICATSDGGAALVLTSMDFARRHAGTDDLVTIDAVSTVTPRFPQAIIEMPNFATDSGVSTSSSGTTFKQSVALAAYEEAGIGPDDLDTQQFTALLRQGQQALASGAPETAAQLLTGAEDVWWSCGGA